MTATATLGGVRVVTVGAGAAKRGNAETRKRGNEGGGAGGGVVNTGTAVAAPRGAARGPRLLGGDEARGKGKKKASRRAGDQGGKKAGGEGTEAGAGAPVQRKNTDLFLCECIDRRTGRLVCVVAATADPFDRAHGVMDQAGRGLLPSAVVVGGGRASGRVGKPLPQSRPRLYPLQGMARRLIVAVRRDPRGGAAARRVVAAVEWVGGDSVFDQAHFRAERLEAELGEVVGVTPRGAPTVAQARDLALSRFESRYGERATRRLLTGEQD